MENKQKIIIAVGVLILVVGGWYVFFSSRGASPESQNILEDIKETILTQKDCKSALIQLEILLEANPGYAEAWQFRGVCQFQSGDNASAKVSFEKVLSLDHDMVAAKNYLQLIGDGQQAVVSKTDFGSQRDFEVKLGFTPDSRMLRFERLPVVQVVPVTATTTREFSIGVYSGQKSATEIQSYLTTTLKSLSTLSFTVTQSDTSTTFNVIVVPGKKSYSISITKAAPVQVLITYSSI